MSADASLAHLRAHLDALVLRVGRAVEIFRAEDPEPGDRFRGLYLADHHVDDLLVRAPGRLTVAARSEEAERLRARTELEADAAEESGVALRLRRLGRTAGLTRADVDVLVAALAPDVDPRIEPLYGYLQDDVTRKRAGLLLALALAGLDPGDPAARGRVHVDAPLRRHGLLLVESLEEPVLARPLRVPDRVTAHLLGDDEPDEALSGLLVEVDGEARWAPEAVAALARGRFVHLRERPGGEGVDAAAAAAREVMGVEPVVVDLALLDDPDRLGVVEAAVRETTLRGAALVGWRLDALDDDPAFVRRLAAAPIPRILIGARSWEPSWSARAPVALNEPSPAPERRSEWWRRHLGSVGFDVADVTAPYRLSRSQVRAASAAARLRAEVRGTPVTPEDVRAGALMQNAAGLERLARRIRPRASWEDLVVLPTVRAQLDELVARARHRDRVLGWGVGGPASRARGITALFAGQSGTGKTLSAEVVAGELGLDMYVIDLSTVVDKYIGETEKNLERIFVEAERVNGVLVFDEADALFGKRSEVRDAHDRHANVEVAYLLQRMELFEGLAVLTTNLRANVDEAFTRRLDVIVDFPEPDVEERRALWRLYLNHDLPTAADVDVGFLASRFQLTGAGIRNVVTTAAYLAAANDVAVGMVQLVRGTEREYRKLGRLTHESEFGEWLGALARAEKEAIR